MKKLLLLLSVLILSACTQEESGYKDVETNDEQLFAVYYFDSLSTDDTDYYGEYFDEFHNNVLFDITVFDAKGLDPNTSEFGGYDGEPVIHIVENNVIIETYVGDEIYDYITKYSDLDYDDFINHHASSYKNALTQTTDRYIEYYYSDTCSHCRRSKPDVLEMFSNDPGMEFYLYNLSDLGGPVPIDGFLGTPTLYVIENGEIVEEYIGPNQIREFTKTFLED